MNCPDEDDAPVVPAYRTESGSLVMWCEHERRWHWHGGGDGDRVPHCVCPRSPYRATLGYVLREVGPLTSAVKKAHRETRAKSCPGCR